MKYKINIPAIFLAILVFIASNGVAMFEHICNTSNTITYCLFTPPNCENENTSSQCCEKMGLKIKKDCCEHKQFFSKLNIEGFTANQIQIKPLEKVIIKDIFFNLAFSHFNSISQNYISGIPPPGNLLFIKYLLRPTPVSLQTFRC